MGGFGDCRGQRGASGENNAHDSQEKGFLLHHDTLCSSRETSFEKQWLRPCRGMLVPEMTATACQRETAGVDLEQSISMVIVLGVVEFFMR